MTCCNEIHLKKQPYAYSVRIKKTYICIYQKEKIYVHNFLEEISFIVHLVQIHMRSVNSLQLLVMHRRMAKDSISNPLHFLCVPKGTDAGFWQRK